MAHQTSVEIGGRQMSFETGKMARQANGAVVLRYGDTVVLSTACMDSKPTEKDFLPLDRRLSRVHLLRRQNSRRLLQARRPSFRARNP